jgi:hypothetical protein
VPRWEAGLSQDPEIPIPNAIILNVEILKSEICKVSNPKNIALEKIILKFFNTYLIMFFKGNLFDKHKNTKEHLQAMLPNKIGNNNTQIICKHNQVYQ